MRSEVYLGLGSNLGDRAANIRSGLEALAAESEGLVCSGVYETTAFGFRDQPRYLNAVCRLWTRLDSFSFLHRVLEIERGVGRRRSFPNAPRILDIDVLLYGRTVMKSPSLTVPHPGIPDRAFVLIPLAEIAPHLTHPVSGETVLELSRRLQLDQRTSVRRLAISP